MPRTSARAHLERSGSADLTSLPLREPDDLGGIREPGGRAGDIRLYTGCTTLGLPRSPPVTDAGASWTPSISRSGGAAAAARHRGGDVAAAPARVMPRPMMTSTTLHQPPGDQRLIEAARSADDLDEDKTRHVRVIEYELPDRDETARAS
jgi:hypothetical protein